MIHNIARGAGGLTSNAFLVDGGESGRTTLVDPGSEFDAVGAVEERAGGLDAVVLTHTHPDHVGNTGAVVDAFDVEVWGFDPDHTLVDRAVADGDDVQLGTDDYRALHTPGHKDDHLCFYSADADVLFAGDLVFVNGGFGRTDLPEGDRATLVESIEYVLETVDEDLQELHTGHGPSADREAYDHLELAYRSARMR